MNRVRGYERVEKFFLGRVESIIKGERDKFIFFNCVLFFRRLFLDCRVI